MKRDNVKKIMWGIVLIAIAALLLGHELGFEIRLGNIRWYEWIVLAFCVHGLISGIHDREWWKVTYAAGISYCVLDDFLNLPHINIWVMLLAITVGGIGFHILFGRKAKFDLDFNGRHYELECNGNDKEVVYTQMQEELEDENVELFADNCEADVNDYFDGDVVFSNITKYIDSSNFRGGSGDIVFSTEKIYLDHCSLFQDRATIEMDVVFSTLEIYVPKDWNVIDQYTRIFSHRADFNQAHIEGAPTLVLRGDCVFGSVRVIRI